MRPGQQQFITDAAAVSNSLVSCQGPSETAPVLYWRDSLPLLHGAVNWEFLTFAYNYWHVLPAAVGACPPSGNSRNSIGAFRDY
jgi:hypothetical protein